MAVEKAHLSLSQALTLVEGELPPLPPTTIHPALVMLVGLPGSGKSYLARRLAEEAPFFIVESDWVRKALFPTPSYSPEESTLTHRACHALIEKLLRRGVRVIYDATNLIEFQREFAYRLAERTGARLVIVKVVASEGVIRERLDGRQEARTPGDISDADWDVYQRMLAQEESIRRPHLVVDTSGGLEEGVRKILREVRRRG